MCQNWLTQQINCHASPKKECGSAMQEAEEDKLPESAAGGTVQGVAAVNGVELHYVCCGNGPHAVICIPGAIGTAILHYQHQLDYLAREGSGFKVVSFDPRGCGKSQKLERPAEITDALQTDARDAYELMMYLALPTFSVIGWCDGGVAGILLASLYPKAIRKLVVMGTRSYITATEQLEVYENTRDISNWDSMAGKVMKIYGSEAAVGQKWSHWLDTVTECYTKHSGDICKSHLPKVSCPMLIVHGAKDGMCPVFHAQYLHARSCGWEPAAGDGGREAYATHETPPGI